MELEMKYLWKQNKHQFLKIKIKTYEHYSFYTTIIIQIMRKS